MYYHKKKSTTNSTPTNWVLAAGWLLLCTLLFSSFTTLHYPLDSTLSMGKHMVVIRNNKLNFKVFHEYEATFSIEDIHIFAPPSFGDLTINNDYTFTFTPHTDVCEEQDQFSYYLHQGTHIDTVTIHIEILCEKLTFFSGFSPDGDGKNDHFTILGVEAFPNNHLMIFNKWGEEVYSVKGYKNNWNGEGAEAKSYNGDSSNYYYVFEDGKGETYSGYIKIK